MGNIVALWVSASWPHPSSARVPQRRHPGLLGHGRPASNLLTQGGTGAARRDFFSWCVKAPQHFLSLQINWMSKYLQEPFLQKYALKIAATGELVGLGAYRNMPEGFLVYIEYIESAPHSNPTLSKNRKYRGIGAALLAYGVQLSIDSGYGGTIYLKAKTSEIREHYIRDFGAIPFSHREPFLLLIDGEAARNLLFQFMKEEL